MSDISQIPFIKLLTKGVKWKQTVEEENAFIKLKGVCYQ